ncbi:MAG: hypothetical protein M1826_001973 [Phylliscum demangeonii]|nr:MAG: hypothetical protein M1826_001973 [Phylliscum demangeonii]
MPRSTQHRLSPDDNLEAILVVDTFLRMSCQSTGADRLVPGQWVVDSLMDGSVYDYGEVLRRQSGTPSLLGLQLPSFLRSPNPRHLVLPPKRDVLSLTADQLGSRVGLYSLVLDPNRHNAIKHVFTAEVPFDDHDPIFTGSTPPPPTFWLPGFVTNPIFIAAMAADAPKEVGIKAYRLWGSLEPEWNGVCTVHMDEHDSKPLFRYRALFLLYGRGNAIRDHKNKWSRPPVCHEPAKKVATGGRRAAASSKLAFLARHQARPTL